MPSDSTAETAGPPTDTWSGLWYGLGLARYAVVVAVGSLLALVGYWDAFLLLGGSGMLQNSYVACTFCKLVSGTLLVLGGWVIVTAGLGGAAYHLRHRRL